MSFSSKVKGEICRYVDITKSEALAQISAIMKVSGTIGFIDLIVPHLVRKIFGSNHKVVIPMCILLGGSFMVLTDLVARTIISPSELPVGAITAIIGAPFFGYLYFSKRSR